jgi:hypothetical protein
MGSDIKAKLLKGDRPAAPEGVSHQYTALIQKCWAADAKSRPTFSEISKVAEERMNEK